jgi:hypothetical protein
LLNGLKIKTGKDNHYENKWKIIKEI